MKIIKLKVLDKDSQRDKLDYRDLIKSMAQQPSNPRAGLTLDEVKKGVRILDALEAAKDVLKLEDADYNLLMAKLKTHKFGIAHKNIIQFADDLEKAEEVK